MRFALRVYHIAFEAEKPIGPFVADFYLPDHDAIIECDGDYWHSLGDRPARDTNRDAWFADHSITTIRIPEWAILLDPYAALRLHAFPILFPGVSGHPWEDHTDQKLLSSSEATNAHNPHP